MRKRRLHWHNLLHHSLLLLLLLGLTSTGTATIIASVSIHLVVLHD